MEQDKKYKVLDHGNILHCRYIHIMSQNVQGSMSNVQTKQLQKKHQPAASDTPDLIQTEHVTDSRLAYPKRKKENGSTSEFCLMTGCTKTEKCQPAAGDTSEAGKI